jgi:LAO/AO transport system kinase
LARATTAAIAVLDAAGFERIVVETVGVGQAEIDIASAAHTTVVVEAPGLGDEVQAIKAGVLEIADIFAVNKADREGAERTVLALQTMQGLALTGAAAHHGQAAGGVAGPGAQADGAWLPPIIKTIAPAGDGVLAVRDWIEAHRAYLATSGQRTQRERKQAASLLDHILRERLLAALYRALPAGAPAEAIAAIAQRTVDPYRAADEILAQAACLTLGRR